jgi:Ni/Fe-hydrogenase subunit HybB-like protein
MNRVQNTKLVLWLITGLAAAVALNRFIFGLGATTNLNDATPWGLWIGVDVMGGVALAGGGFVITAIFYIMKRDEFHPLVKPAVLTAFLGYLAVILGLMFDLGLPWNIWHMIVYWNPHSPLFEVGWCVMLYTTVLLLEFSPVPLEKFSRYAKIRNFLMKFRFVFVLLGIMLSTLHQSSLGSLFLIMPFKIYPLWYSSILPIEFFISAVALGLMMVAFESLVSHWLYRRTPEKNLVAKLGKAVSWVLGIYLLVKMVDLGINGKLGLIFSGVWESNLFIIEILISTIVPMIIFAFPRLRDKNGFQWIGSSMVVVGMVLNRIDVGGLTMLGATGDSYFPSWMEITVTLGVISVAALVFLFVIEHFHVWEIQPKDPESLKETPPSFDYASRVWLGNPEAASLTKYSLAFVISFAVGMALMPEQKILGKGINDIKVYRASGKDTLLINGNRDNYFVEFPHKSHIKRIGENNCIKCHHLTLPGYQENSCWECHTSMYKATAFFRHDQHTLNSNANIKCNVCHTPGMNRTAATAKNCVDCHPQYDISKFQSVSNKKYEALSYTDAMHKLCVSCHINKSKELKDKPYLAQCSTCHQTGFTKKLEASIKWEVSSPHFNQVILPDVNSEALKKE